MGSAAPGEVGFAGGTMSHYEKHVAYGAPEQEEGNAEAEARSTQCCRHFLKCQHLRKEDAKDRHYHGCPGYYGCQSVFYNERLRKLHPQPADRFSYRRREPRN